MSCFQDTVKKDRQLSAAEQLPRDKRQIRDLPCLILFATVIVAAVLVAVIAVSEGNLLRLLNGYDNYGDVCGQNNSRLTGVPLSGRDYSDKSVLLIHNSLSQEIQSNIIKDFGSSSSYFALNRTCVMSCPAGGQRVTNYCFFNDIIVENNTGSTNSSLMTDSTSSSSLSTAGQVSRETVFPLANFFEEVSRDIELAWPQLAAICSVALGLATLLLLLFRFLAWMIVYVVILIVVAGAVTASGFLWYLYCQARDSASTADISVSKVRQRDATYLLLLAITTTVFTALLLIVLFVMRKRIRLVTALFREAGKAIQAMPCLLVQPLCTFVAILVAIAAWLVVALAIESMGTPETAEHSGFVRFKKQPINVFFRYYNIFAIVWISQFISGCQDMVVGGAVSNWFFIRDKSQLRGPICRAVRRLVLFHLGSVAVGSLVLAAVRLVRAILRRLHAQMARHGAARAVCCCCRCCVWCFDALLQYISRNAYVEIMIYGCSFCDAAKQAFNMFTKNALRVAAISSIGSFIMILGKAAVTISTVFIGIEIIKGRSDVTHSYIIISIGAVFAYTISCMFVSIYEMAIDTLFVCFCEDCNMNDGVIKPYYMNKGLMEFVENSKKALAALKQKRSQTAPLFYVATPISTNNRHFNNTTTPR